MSLMHPKIWVNVLLDFICMGFVTLQGMQNKRKEVPYTDMPLPQCHSQRRWNTNRSACVVDRGYYEEPPSGSAAYNLCLMAYLKPFDLRVRDGGGGGGVLRGTTLWIRRWWFVFYVLPKTVWPLSFTRNCPLDPPLMICFMFYLKPFDLRVPARWTTLAVYTMKKDIKSDQISTSLTR